MYANPHFYLCQWNLNSAIMAGHKAIILKCQTNYILWHFVTCHVWWIDANVDKQNRMEYNWHWWLTNGTFIDWYLVISLLLFENITSNLSNIIQSAWTMDEWKSLISLFHKYVVTTRETRGAAIAAPWCACARYDFLLLGTDANWRVGTLKTHRNTVNIQLLRLSYTYCYSWKRLWT